MKLTVRNLCKSFGDLHVLNGFDLEMESGRIYCLMGPSGSGKTTLLRVLMGLEEADGGSVLWEDTDPSGRSFGYSELDTARAEQAAALAK